MNHNHHSHHDPRLPEYKIHVFRVGKNDFCTGCFGSKSFLIFILPILMFLFIYPNSAVSVSIDWTIIIVLWLISATLYVFEIITAKHLNGLFAKIFLNLYLFGTITYVATVPSDISLPNSKFLMIWFSLPQITIYVYKIITSTEFTKKRVKFIARILFIISFFFSLLNFLESPLMNSITIVSGILIFTRLRSFSGYRVAGKRGENKLIISEFAQQGIFSKLLSKLHVLDESFDLKELNKHSSFIWKLYFIITIGILYLLGPITSVSSLTNNCSIETSNGDQSGLLFSVPWIMMSGSGKVYCTTCGAPNQAESKFCENCGNEIKAPEQNIQSQPRSYPPQQNYPAGGIPNQSYQSRTPQSHRRNRDSNTPIVIGVIIGILVMAATANIVLGIILGVITYYGVKFAQSTNDPCLSYCVMSSLCNCICSAMDSESNRRGRF